MQAKKPKEYRKNKISRKRRLVGGEDDAALFRDTSNTPEMLVEYVGPRPDGLAGMPMTSSHPVHPEQKTLALAG